MFAKSLLFVLLLSQFHHFVVKAQVDSGPSLIDSDQVNNSSRQIVIKLNEKSNLKIQSSSNHKSLHLEELKGIISIKNIRKLNFSNSKTSGTTTFTTSSSLLDNIFFVELNSEEELKTALKKILEYSNVEYAESISQAEILFTPNDANINSQSSLKLIKAFEAWDVTKGDETLVIGVSDTGAQLDHVDLIDNLYYNIDDPINNIDDDANGYVDDFNGWDFADSDNDPTADQNGHGTQVAGLSSASTNNAIGMAGIGYNCKFAPLKVFRSSNGFSFNLYESIIYAADQGFDVINLSWGSQGNYSQFEQDVINYAVLEKNMVVVAAAGNTNAELQFYPASYDHVVSVANTTMEDVKAPGATYSYKVDLTAPGYGVYSTKNDNSYASESGSSFSSPQVAGAAALVKSAFPNLSAIQIMEQLRVSADDIYSIAGNTVYIGLLGKGRLNVFNAVSKSDLISIRIAEFSYSNSFGEYAFYDDSVTISLDFFNYLGSTVNASATLSSNNTNVSFVDPILNIGALSSLELSNLFKTQILISDEAQHDERIIIRMDFEDDNYQDFQYFEFPIIPDNLNISNTQLSLNISRNGDLIYPANFLSKSRGLKFKGESVGEFLGVMIGNHPDSISDNVLNDFFVFTREQDFKARDKIKFHHNPNIDWHTKSTFDDSHAGLFSLGLIIEQEALAWNDDLNDEFAILEYRVTNNTTEKKSDLHVSFFADWDLGARLNNKSSWDNDNKLAYSYSENESQYIGVALLTDQPTNIHSIDLASENGNTAEMSTVFSNEKKFDFMTTSKLNAGELGSGNNVAQVLSAIVGQLDAYHSEKVAFVLVGAESLESLQENVLRAKIKYDQFIENPPIASSELVCNDLPFGLNIDNGNNFEIFDDAYMSNLLATGNNFAFDGLKEDSLVYVRNIDGDFASDIFRIRITVENPNTNFTIDPDTLYLGDKSINQVSIVDQSESSISWDWSFGNGSFSKVQNPKVIYNEAGEYDIELNLETEMGCQGTLIKKLIVADRSPEPIVEELMICKGDDAIIASSNSPKLRIYKSFGSDNPIFVGQEFILKEVQSDTTFYISSIQNIFESHRVPVTIKVKSLEIDFLVIADTLNLNSKKQINVIDNSKDAVGYEWYVNDDLIGNSNQESYVFGDESTLDIKLKVTNSDGCLDSLNRVMLLKISKKPVISDIVVCRFDEVELKPANGEIFFFYDNPDLDNPVHKGRKYKTGKISTTSKFYITNVDDFKESESKEVVIDIFPFQTEIIADPDTLILSQAKNVLLAVVSEQEIIETKWYVNDILVESALSPIVNFDASGEYGIDLIARNDAGCQDTTSLSYIVINVPITGIFENVESQISIYPNPTEGLIHLIGSSSFKKVQLFHMTGQQVKSFDVLLYNKSILDVSELENGLYLLKGEYEGVFFTKKVLIQKSNR